MQQSNWADLRTNQLEANAVLMPGVDKDVPCGCAMHRGDAIGGAKLRKAEKIQLLIIGCAHRLIATTDYD
jgi:hypothetical protein